MVDLRHIDLKGNIQRILIVRLSSLGDIIHTLPAVLLLKKMYPKAMLHWIVKENYAEVFKEVDFVDKVIPLDIEKWKKEFFTKETITQIFEISKKLKDTKYELAIDFQGSIKSGFISLLSRAPVRLSFSPFYCREPLAAFFANVWVKPKELKMCHKVEKNIKLLEPLNIKRHQVEFGLKVPPKSKKLQEFFENSNFLNSKSAFVALNPGARWETKRWPTKHWVALTERLAKSGLTPILIWGPGEEKIVNEIVKEASFPPVVAPPTTLGELISFIANTDLFIAGDTGPLHIAAALGVPVIGLYGPTDPRLNGPYGQLDRVIMADISCRGCWRRRCSKLECMENIKPEAVFNLVRKIKVKE